MTKSTGYYTKWTPEMDRTLTDLWGHRSRPSIGKDLGLPVGRVERRAKKLRLPRYRVGKPFEPTKQQWIDVATEKAHEAGVSAVRLMAGKSHKPITHARWRAFKAILERNPYLSIAGVARVAGFDHTTVLNGLKRLPQIEQMGCR